jgi:UDP-N-acetylmuramate--alanine ligase
VIKEKNIHFVGIGGIGVSALAHILKEKGKIVSGSDSTNSEILDSLKRSGIPVYIGHDGANITEKHQLVVYSPAIPEDNPELKRARKLKIKLLSYPKALGELSQEYFTIAISGTHGKSTTTAMISRIAEEAGLDPTIVIGTKMREFKNRNFRIGKSKYLIVEACEYKESFLSLHPQILVITNIESDHLDYFKNFGNYKRAFEKMVERVPSDGYLVINGKDIYCRAVSQKCKGKILSAGTSKDDDYLMENRILVTPKGKLTINPKVYGRFNIENGALAAIVGQILDIPNKKIEQSLSGFTGTWRRLELKKKKLGKVKFIDDYAHHPTEIQTTLAAIRETFPREKILCIFQPHQYNRTIHFLKEFGASFNDVNQVIVPNIYEVRDTASDVEKISTDTLVKEIKKHNKNVFNGDGFRNTVKYMKENHPNFDVIVTMGAGDINKLYKMF